MPRMSLPAPSRGQRVFAFRRPIAVASLHCHHLPFFRSQLFWQCWDAQRLGPGLFPPRSARFRRTLYYANVPEERILSCSGGPFFFFLGISQGCKTGLQALCRFCCPTSSTILLLSAVPPDPLSMLLPFFLGWSRATILFFLVESLRFS